MDRQGEDILLRMTTIIKKYDPSFTKIKATATGFFCRNKSGNIFLVTNYHVIKNSDYFMLYLSLICNKGKIKINENVALTIDKNSQDVIINEEYDVCIIAVKNLCEDLRKNGIIPNIAHIPYTGFVNDFSNYNHIERVMIIGYPNSLINGIPNLPLVREGITATGMCVKLEDKDQFIINIPVVHGSIGSPVFRINENDKLELVGIVTHLYYEETKVKDINDPNKTIGIVKMPNGLGRVTKSNIILELLDQTN